MNVLQLMRYLCVITIILPLISIPGCAKKEKGHILAPGEDIVSTYPGGEIKETAFFEGEKPNRRTLKSFEYYPSGEKKREYSYKDNHYFGKWNYWYKNGATMAEGEFDRKTLNPFKGMGSGTYYWPDSKKMIEITIGKTAEGKDSEAIYYDTAGNAYTNDNIHDELKNSIRDIIQKWEKGEV